MRWRSKARAVPAALSAYWRRPTLCAPGRVDWLAILIFFVVACAWSHLAARWGALHLPGGADAPRIQGTLLVGFGPVLGALVAGIVRPAAEHGPVCFGGTRPRWTAVALAVPLVVAAIGGVRRFHIDAHLDAAVMTASILIACTGEELGWREWLFNALAGLPLWGSALVTWMLWLTWHLAFPPSAVGLSGRYDPIFTLTLLVASFGLAALMRETHASGLATAWHGALRAPGPLAAMAMMALLGLVSWRAIRNGSASSSGAYPDSRPPTS